MNVRILTGTLTGRVLPVVDVVAGYYYIKAPFWGGPWAFKPEEVELVEELEA